MTTNYRRVAQQFTPRSPRRRWRNARQKVRALAVCCALLIPAFSPDADAAEPGRPFLTLTLENDLFVGRDEGYTNGTGITFGRGELTEFSAANTPAWIRWMTKDLYISTMPGKERGIAHMFFQRMQTPKVITDPAFNPDDLSYAGLAAWQGTMYAWDDQVSDQLSLYLGMVGPATYAKQTQKAIHRMIGADEPLGWKYQLENEPVFKIEVQRIRTLYRSRGSGLKFDVLGLGGFGVGTLESAAKVGLALRVGHNLQKSIGGFSLQVDRYVNPLAFSNNNDWYAYVGVRGGYVANDILINGNTFRDSHSVPLEHVQDEVAAGIVWKYGRIAMAFQLSTQSSRSKLSSDRGKFGGISLTYSF